MEKLATSSISAAQP